MQQERLGLLATEPAVEPDQLLEGGALVGVRVVEAVDEDVGGVDERARAAEVVGAVRAERGERVLALDAVVDEVADAAAADRQRAEFLGVDEDEPDARMFGEAGEETRIAGAERLEAWRDPPAW